MIRISHSADWHLKQDATCARKIVLDETGQNIRWLDQQRVVKHFVDGAFQHEADLAVIVGDIFDRPRPSPAEIVFAQQQIRRLAREIPTFVIPGNHDMAIGTDPSVVAALDLGMRNLHVLSRPEILTEYSVQIASLPFPSKAMLLAKEEYAGLGPEAVNLVISEKLRTILRGFLVKLDPKRPSLLLAHLIIQGAALNDDQVAGQEHISLTREDLDGWSLVCLGDLHLCQQVGKRAWYSGSLERTDFGMEHHAPGWLLHTLDGDSLQTEAIETPARRYVTLSTDELIHSEPYPDIVYRIKERMSQEELDAIQPHLARWQQGTQLFCEQIEVTRQARTREASMQGDLSPEASLRQWCTANGKTEMFPVLFQAHQELTGCQGQP